MLSTHFILLRVDKKAQSHRDSTSDKVPVLHLIVPNAPYIGLEPHKE